MSEVQPKPGRSAPGRTFRRDSRDDGRGRRSLHGLEATGLPGMLRHGGGSFLVGYPFRTTRRVKKPPLLHQKINRSWDNPAPDLLPTQDRPRESMTPAGVCSAASGAPSSARPYYGVSFQSNQAAVSYVFLVQRRNTIQILSQGLDHIGRLRGQRRQRLSFGPPLKTPTLVFIHQTIGRISKESGD